MYWKLCNQLVFIKNSHLSYFCYCLLACLITLISCENKARKSNFLVEKGSFYLRKDKKGPYKQPQVFEDQTKSSLCYLRPEQKRIDIFNLILKDTVDPYLRINLERVLPLGEQFIDYYVQNFDSIFVYTFTNHTISLINSDGELIKSWPVSRYFPKGKKGTITINPWSPIKYNGGNIYAPYNPDGLTLFDTKKWYSSNPIALIGLPESDSAKVISTLATYPEIYRHDFYRELAPAFALSPDGNLVASFQIDDNLYNISPDGKYTTIKQPFRLDLLQPFPHDSSRNFRYVARYGVEQPRYISISYDPYRQKYYRVFKKNCDWIREDGTINSRTNCPWELIILDISLKEEAIIKMPPMMYYFDFVAPIKEGIMVWADHSLNPSYSDSISQFTLFKIQK